MKSSLAITDYQGWASSRAIHPAVVSFLTTYGHLNPLGWVLTGSDGWSKVSTLLKGVVNSKDEPSRVADITEVLGQEGANLFLRFYSLWFRLPSVSSVLDGTAGEMPENLRDPMLGTVFLPRVAEALTDRLRLLRRGWGPALLIHDDYRAWARQAENAMTYFAPLPVEHRVKFVSILLAQDDTATRDLFERPAFWADRDLFVEAE